MSNTLKTLAFAISFKINPNNHKFSLGLDSMDKIIQSKRKCVMYVIVCKVIGTKLMPPSGIYSYRRQSKICKVRLAKRGSFC